MSALTEGSPWAKIGFICLILALLLHIISFSAPNWASTNDDFTKNEHFGLWRYCTEAVFGGKTCQDFIHIGNTGDWLKACQAFMTLALFALLPAVAFVALIAIVPDFKGETKFQVLAVALTAVSGVFLLIGVSVFAGKYGEYFRDREAIYDTHSGELGWAFGLACCSTFLTFVTLILVLVEMTMGESDY